MWSEARIYTYVCVFEVSLFFKNQFYLKIFSNSILLRGKCMRQFDSFIWQQIKLSPRIKAIRIQKRCHPFTRGAAVCCPTWTSEQKQADREPLMPLWKNPSTPGAYLQSIIYVSVQMTSMGGKAGAEFFNSFSLKSVSRCGMYPSRLWYGLRSRVLRPTE